MSRHFGRRLLVVCCWVELSMAVLPGAKQRLNPFTLSQSTAESLEQNRNKQIQNAKGWMVFHGFKFSNQDEASGIDFVQKPVDAAAKNYLAVHYDHGNALAAADVDNDGRLDLLFANQIGGNQLWRNAGRGRFENITSQAGVALAGKISVAAAFADIDNDGRAEKITALDSRSKRVKLGARRSGSQRILPGLLPRTSWEMRFAKINHMVHHRGIASIGSKG